jgi:hypothetical protein
MYLEAALAAADEIKKKVQVQLARRPPSRTHEVKEYGS